MKCSFPKISSPELIKIFLKIRNFIDRKIFRIRSCYSAHGQPRFMLGYLILKQILKLLMLIFPNKIPQELKNMANCSLNNFADKFYVYMLGRKEKYDIKFAFVKTLLKLYVLCNRKKCNPNYDIAVSLGYNCEPYMRMNELYSVFYPNQSFEPYIFSWTYINNREKFLEILADLDKLNNAQFKIGIYEMIQDEYSEIAFHGKSNGPIRNSDGEIIQDIFNQVIEELKSRIAHLVEKTKDLFVSDKKTLFVMKAPKTELEKDREFIENVYKILEEKYISGKFKLLVVVPRNEYSQNDLSYLRAVENSRLKIADIKRYSHELKNWYDGDRVGWLLNIFKEYVN